MGKTLKLLGLILTALTLPLLTGCGDDDHHHSNSNRKTIVFMSMSSGSNSVWRMFPDGSKKAMLAATDAGVAIQGTLSPDGRKLLFVRQVSGTGDQIIEQDLKTDVQKVLFTDPIISGDNDFAPSYNPDGTKIAYHDDLDGIHVMNADGTNNLLLPNTTGVDHTPSWNSSGTKIVFDRGWNGSIYVMKPDGTEQTLVIAEDTDADTTYGQPRFLPDGRIICMRSGISKDIVIMNADGSGLVNLTPDTDSTDEFFPSVNSDGTQIAFSKSDSILKIKDVYVGTLSGTTVTNLVNITADRDINCWRPLFGVIDTSYATIAP